MEENTLNDNNVSEDTMEWGRNDDVVKWGKIKDTNKRDESEDIRRYIYYRMLLRTEMKQLEQQDQRIIEIVHHLVKNHNYVVFGHWFCNRWKCKHKSRCSSKRQCKGKGVFECQDEWECKHEPQCRNKVQDKKKWEDENICRHRWRILYTQESLKKYLREAPRIPTDFFTQYCDKCNERTLISSFLLYRPNRPNKNPIEIICHLEWNNHYRVFGNWKCLYCNNRWISAYSWISLQKFIEQKHLSQDDLFIQECNKCKHGNCTISNYKPLELSDGINHKRNLCAKCQHGEYCIEIDDYYGH